MSSVSIARAVVLWIALTVMPLASALAQNGGSATGLQPKLEVFAKQSDFYWVVATDPDGARRGGWVTAQIIESINTNALRPVPAAPPPVVQPAVMPAIIAPNDFDGIVLALQNMRGKVSSAATTLEGLPDGITLRNRLDRIDQATVLVRELAVDQNFGKSALRLPEPARPAVESVVVTPASAKVNAVAVQTSTAVAPRYPQTREGFWFSGGFGYGVLGCDSCDGHANGFSGGLSLGRTMSERFLLGVGTTGWYKSQDGIMFTTGTIDGRFRFYPSTTNGFFITGGAGLGSISASMVGLGGNTEYGVGIIVGLGYDIRVRPNLSLTPYWNGYAVRTSNADANVGQLGLNITVH